MKSHVVAGPGHNKEEEQRAWTLLIMQSIPRSAFVSNPKEQQQEEEGKGPQKNRYIQAERFVQSSRQLLPKRVSKWR